MPLWLEKWTALILDFIEEEQSLLPSQLLSLRLPAPSFAPLYTPAGALAEAKGVSCSALLIIGCWLAYLHRQPMVHHFPLQDIHCAARKAVVMPEYAK